MKHLAFTMVIFAPVSTGNLIGLSQNRPSSCSFKVPDLTEGGRCGPWRCLFCRVQALESDRFSFPSCRPSSCGFCCGQFRWKCPFWSQLQRRVVELAVPFRHLLNQSFQFRYLLLEIRFGRLLGCWRLYGPRSPAALFICGAERFLLSSDAQCIVGGLGSSLVHLATFLCHPKNIDGRVSGHCFTYVGWHFWEDLTRQTPIGLGQLREALIGFLRETRCISFLLCVPIRLSSTSTKTSKFDLWSLSRSPRTACAGPSRLTAG